MDAGEPQKNIEQFKIKRMIKRLNESKSAGTSMISIIIPPKKQISEITKMLAEEQGRAANIKDRVNRQSVLEAITAALQRLKLYNRTPNNGLVLYVGRVIDSETKAERKLLIDFEPFKPINASIYYCDPFFHTEDLSPLLENEQPFGFIIMDGHGCLFATLSGNTRDVLQKFSVDLPKKHGRGGQSSMRFARLRVEKRHNYLRKVCETAVSCFIQQDRVTVQGKKTYYLPALVLAGSAEFKNELAETQMLDPRLQTKIVKILDVQYGGENGLNQAIEQSQDQLANVRLVQDKNIIQKFFDAIAQDSNVVVYGVTNTMNGFESNALERIVCFEGLNYFRIKRRDKETLKEDVIYLPFQDLGIESRFQHETASGEIVEYEQLECEQLVDWLAENYSKSSTELIFVTDKSVEGTQFFRGFGGICGFLRYQMNFEYLKNDYMPAVQEESDDDDFI